MLDVTVEKLPYEGLDYTLLVIIYHVTPRQDLLTGFHWDDDNFLTNTVPVRRVELFEQTIAPYANVIVRMDRPLFNEKLYFVAKRHGVAQYALGSLVKREHGLLQHVSIDSLDFVNTETILRIRKLQLLIGE